MDERILFKNSNGGLSVMTPTGVLSVKETALQDVPTGVKFKIINFSELPSDITFRDAWEYDFTDSYDGVGE